MEGLKKRIELWLEPELEEMNCYLVDVRILNGGGKIEVYIDNKENPVTIGECEKVSRYLELHLDNDASVSGKYVLDVSSPGMENPFKVPLQYKKNKGRVIQIQLNDGTIKEGILKDSDEEKIIIDVQHPPKKKHLKPEVTPEEVLFSDIKTVKKKVTF